MLNSYDVIPTVPTSDLDGSRTFYEDVLGFVATEENTEGIIYSSGSGGFLLYQSDYAGTNKATCMSFTVPDDESFDSEVAMLSAKGVVFDVFETEEGTWDGPVLTVDGMRSVWFSDPDENIINIEVSQS